MEYVPVLLRGTRRILLDEGPWKAQSYAVHVALSGYACEVLSGRLMPREGDKIAIVSYEDTRDDNEVGKVSSVFNPDTAEWEEPG